MCANIAISVLNQQYGFSPSREFDPMYYRLHCDDSPVVRSPIFACKSAPKPGNEHVVALANEDGYLKILNCETNKKYSYHAHSNAIFDVAWRYDAMHVVTASGDHSAKLFDIGDGCVKELRMFVAHDRSVKTVAFQREDSCVLATGSRDGSIVLWDTRSAGKIMGLNTLDFIIRDAHVSKDINAPCNTNTKKKYNLRNSTCKSSSVKSVTGLVFQNSTTLISCGAGDGMIKFWDLRKHCYPRQPLPIHVIPYSGKTAKNGFSNLLLDSARVKLYVNCLDNKIYCYNVASYNNTEPVMTYTGHENNSFYIKSSLDKNENYLIGGSSDSHAYIWNLKQSQPLVKLTGHGAEVTCVAWCNSKPTPSAITCSDDMSYKIWNICGIDYRRNPAGEAEILPRVARGPKKRMCFSKIKIQLPIKKHPIWQCKNCQRASFETLCENCVPSGSKRKANSDLWSESKRMSCKFGPKRLFAHLPGNFQEGEEGQSFKVLDRISEEPLNLKPLNTALESLKAEELTSPTINLPNFVIDGTAPHLNYSPPKRKTQDWLTRVRIERNLRQEMLDKTMQPSSPKSSRLDSTPKSGKKTWTTPKSPLLRFFKVTNSNVKNDNINCSPKTHACDLLNSGEQMNCEKM